MLHELLIDLLNFLFDHREVVLVAHFMLLKLIEEVVVLPVQLLPIQVELRVNTCILFSERLALLPKLLDLHFVVTNALLRNRRVEQAEEYVANILYGESARLVKVFRFPIYLPVFQRNFEPGLLVVERFLLREVSVEVQPGHVLQVLAAQLYLCLILQLLDVIHVINLLLNIVLALGGLVDVADARLLFFLQVRRLHSQLIVDFRA